MKKYAKKVWLCLIMVLMLSFCMTGCSEKKDESSYKISFDVSAEKDDNGVIMLSSDGVTLPNGKVIEFTSSEKVQGIDNPKNHFVYSVTVDFSGYENISENLTEDKALSLDAIPVETAKVRWITSINSVVNNIVWGVPMLVLILGTGIFMTFGMKFFQIRRIGHWMSETFIAIFRKKHVRKHTGKHEKSISQFQALATALAATIGVGNIAGVAGAILTGGPGAVFWMWVSAFFGMMTNYSENVLGIYYRRKNEEGEWCGGAMYYLQDGLKSKKFLKHLAKPLAVLFSIFCVCASFGIGNMSQIHEIASTMVDGFKMKASLFTIGSFTVTPQLVIGIILAVIGAMVILGGIKAIGRVTEKIVPFMALVYIIATITVLVMNIHMVPAVFGAIFEGAFGLRPIAGAAVGTIIKKAVTMGFKRGVFSNEAGLGSSVMVHSASNVKEPVVQGMWGIFEVFFDTIIVCTLTAFTVLSSGLIDLETGAALTDVTGASLVSEALSQCFGGFAGKFVAIAVCLFAFSTVLGWSFYGTKACEYLFGRKATYVYKCIFIVCIVFAATMSFDLAWAISDTFNALMAIPNLIGVIALSGTVFAITKNYTKRKITKTEPDAKPLLSVFEDINDEHTEQLENE